MESAFVFNIGERGRVIAGETMVGELRLDRIAPLLPHSPVKTVDRQKGDGIAADIIADLIQRMGGRQQIFTLRRIDAVKIRMFDRR